MDQLINFADSRLLHSCVYCGGIIDTRDHVPSKIFLDKPFPTNLPVLPACFSCNNGFSSDEEYVVCAIESAIVGSTDPKYIRRPRVAKILRRNLTLRNRIEQRKMQFDSHLGFEIESDRFKNIILKLARGHVAFELSLPCREEPQSVSWMPLPLMTDDQRNSYEAAHVSEMVGEVGSRGMQRTYVTQLSIMSQDGENKNTAVLITDWVDVQEERYSYIAYEDGNNIIVKIIIAGFLACEVVWNNE